MANFTHTFTKLRLRLWRSKLGPLAASLLCHYSQEKRCNLVPEFRGQVAAFCGLRRLGYFWTVNVKIVVLCIVWPGFNSVEGKLG